MPLEGVCRNDHLGFNPLQYSPSHPENPLNRTESFLASLGMVRRWSNEQVIGQMAQGEECAGTLSSAPLILLAWNSAANWSARFWIVKL